MSDVSDPGSQHDGNNEVHPGEREASDPCQLLLNRLQHKEQTHDEYEDEKLIITQINLKRSPTRLKKLRAAMRSEPERWGVVAIQDPPPLIAWPGRAITKTHNVWYLSNRPLVEDDHAMHRHPKQSLVEMAKSVAFLVPKCIPATKWRVEAPDWAGEMLATLHLETRSGKVQIHNVYRNTNSTGPPLDMERLVRECSGTHSVLLGDFNLHHPLWGGAHDKECKDSKILAAAVTTKSLNLCNEPGAITFTRSANPDCSTRSTIDLTFVGSFLHERFLGWSVVDTRGFDSDHRIVRTTLDCPPIIQISTHRIWQDTPLKDFRRAVKTGLEALPRPDLDTTQGIEDGLWRISEVLDTAIKEHVPSDDGQEPVKPPAQTAGSKQLEKTYKQVVTSATTGHDRNTQKWAKRTRQRARPVQSPFTPDFHFQNRVAKTGSDKADMYMEAVYGEGKTSREHSVHPDLPPDIDCSLPPGHELDRMVPGDDKQLGEVLRAIKKLPDRKATGVDIIGNEALKMVGHIITPYLENIFAACLVKCYYPNFLKLSRTILFPKPEKDARLPASYRPIALLTSIGKLLEKVILERLRRALNLLPKSLALPLRQFGGLAGRSTTAALHNLLNFVHIALAKKTKKKKQKASLLSVDITGAFPHADRNKLLQMLADKGVPGYIIKIIWSWMCNRMTVLEIPGHEGQVYYENGGLPQGSCLSPTLFLIFASPLFDVSPFRFKHAFNIFAFVDDTYIAVRSDSHKTNCDVLAWVHGQLQNWAMDNAVTFDPQKYHLLHFLGSDDGVEMIKLRPAIDHLPPDEKLFVEGKPFIEILGVLVDNRLTWKFHIDRVVSKVSKQMRSLKQISGSTWGPDLQRMRMLYTSQIRSAFSYASPAWFITGLSPRMPGTLSAKQVAVLDRLQDECLIEISGAMKGTSAHVIRKELCIPKMSDYLKMRTLAYIAKRTHHCPIYKGFENERRATLTFPLNAHRFEHHPLQQLRTQADQVIEAAKERLEYHHGHKVMLEKWSNAKTRNRAIDIITGFAVHAWCSVEWEQYREDWDKSHSWARPLALAEPWGFDSLLYYDGMTRKDCTMLLHCRTGHIGLAANLHSRNLHPTDRCPLCGKGKHTIEHLFVYCTGRDCYGKEMSKRRATLYKNTEDLTDLHRIFTEHPEEAVKFAFKTFGIPQFTKSSWKITEDKRWNWSQAKKRGHSEATAGDGGDQDAPVKKRKRHKYLDLRRGDPSPEPVSTTSNAAAASQHVS